MKKIIILLLWGLFFSCSHNIVRPNAQIRFTQIEHDFGTLPYKKEVEYNFEFSNPGENILLISNVKTSCGCTTVEWPQKPIKPNESGKITVKYDSEFPGMFYKEVTVYYNGSDSPTLLQIKGQVEYPKEDNPKE